MGKKRAKEHYDFIRKQYHKEIDNSIANTTIHACESIEAFKPTYYAWNNKHLNRGIYLNRALYSKDILFERERQKIYADVRGSCGVGDKELREAMLDRINFMLSIAEEHGVQTLILGAWGCGVFEWNPETVAELFMEVKGRYYIRYSWVI